jgi:anionic cell wall polymer biosynthesis LytR-Cps2A-Psr (LCP) family protein
VPRSLLRSAELVFDNLDAVANKFRFTGGQIQDAAATARNLARWRDPKKAEESRLANLQEVARSLHRELGVRQSQLSLPNLVAALQGEVQTNLSRNETLSLLVTALQPDTSMQFTTLPLDPPRGTEGAAAASPLRERVRTLPDPFWIEPKPPAQPS